MTKLGALIIGAILLAAAMPAAAQAPDEVEKFRSDLLAGRLGWADVVARARKEGRVNFYHWGGSDDLNVWIDSVARPEARREGVALQRVLRVEAALEPLLALLGRAVGPRLRVDPALRLLLDAVVADARCGSKRLADLTR